MKSTAVSGKHPTLARGKTRWIAPPERGDRVTHGLRRDPPHDQTEARSRQILRSFHNKSLGDKDSLASIVYDPVHAGMLIRSKRQADTKVSLAFGAAPRNVR